ncbi:amidohydrolase family protein [Limnoglobus roseus]|uniref:Amidohydrolase n=1 Tax=Limnoglobus roseus TaxID=2598579 RepID=A0A5C1AE75_9BACT|nr:amidohydrolase family protein [Limnoglobus roseus]QEL16012.1 amidohydrolase [Limnoglobus roseus]
MNRRDFLAAGAAVAVLPTLSSAKDAAMLPVVDTHQHLWDLTKFKLGWLKPGSVYDASFTPKEYAEATAGLNVVKAVYMEVDVVPEQQQAEADYLVELCQSGKTPTCAAVVSGRPNSDGFAKYAGQFKGSKYVKGIRQVLHVDSTPPGYCLDPKFVKGIQLLGDLGLSYDLCVRAADIPNFVKLVEQCPNTRFILDHCGNPGAKFTAAEADAWKKNTAALAAKKNVVCKVSGFLANGWEKGKWTAADLAPVVNHITETFGWDRVMFGGDWPVVLAAGRYADWLTALRQIIKDKPEADQKKLLHDNAVAFYGLA